MDFQICIQNTLKYKAEKSAMSDALGNLTLTRVVFEYG